MFVTRVQSVFGSLSRLWRSVQSEGDRTVLYTIPKIDALYGAVILGLIDLILQ